MRVNLECVRSAVVVGILLVGQVIFCKRLDLFDGI